MSDPVEVSGDPDRDLAMIKKAADRLMEHFDCIQIFAQRACEKEKKTIHFKWGLGNIFAREGQVRHWLITQDENAREEVRSRE